MPLPTPWASNWFEDLRRPFDLQPFGLQPFESLDSTLDDYRVYEDEGDVVVTMEVPGFDTDEIDVTWDDGVLSVAASHSDDELGREKTYHRRVRPGREVDEDAIEAAYRNGILEVTLPLADDSSASGIEIPVDG